MSNGRHVEDVKQRSDRHCQKDFKWQMSNERWKLTKLRQMEDVRYQIADG